MRSVVLFVIALLLAVVSASHALETEVIDYAAIDAAGERSSAYFNARMAEVEAEQALFKSLGGDNLGISGVYGVDFNWAYSTSTLSCIKSKLKSATAFAIPRGYRSVGAVDPNVVSNVKNAWAAGFKYVDVYLFPCPTCGNGAGQVSALVSKLRNNGAKFGMIWLDIEMVKYWSNKTYNRAFFESMLQGCANNGVSCGIYSSRYQWQDIVGADYTKGSKYPLWYAHYDKLPNFSDYVAFGGWSKPNIKQYIGDTLVCNSDVDLNVY